MRTRSWIILVVLLAIIVGGSYGWYEYNRKPESLEDQNADHSISSEQLLLEFQQDEVQANKQYLDKIILVEGTVLDVSNDSNILSVYLDAGDPMSTVICEIESGGEFNHKPGDIVKIKGMCTGYLMDIVLIKSVVIN